VTERQEEPVPVHEGPDPRAWPGRQDIWPLAEDLRQADAMLELLDGKVARDGMSPAFDEARAFLRSLAAAAADKLSAALLAAYGIYPDGEGGFATEATGGFSGDGNGEGAGDHLR
jgi:hypothetical protein